MLRIWQLFPSDPLPTDDPAHFWIERLESLLDRGLLTAASQSVNDDSAQTITITGPSGQQVQCESGKSVMWDGERLVKNYGAER